MPRKCPCGNYPSYNIPGQKSRIFCSGCKTDEMVDVKNKRCRCGKRPMYNVSTELKGVCCSKCKTDEMINVVDKRCKCGNHPIYNVSGKTKGMFCSKCKTDEMIDVTHKKCTCGNNPIYNVTGEVKGICCSKCKTDEMVDVKHKVCPGYITECPVRTYIVRGHEYCMSCDPNETRRKRYKRYEDIFFDYVKDKLDVHKREFHVSFDPKETSKKFARLDGVVFNNGVIVCIEVDENCHQEYECDEHRMHLATAELLQKYPEHTVSWVRVNPTVCAKDEWSGPSKKKREKRFDEVVNTTRNILETRDTRIVYIGFD